MRAAGSVYFVAQSGGGLIKIGYSTNAAGRFQQLALGSPVSLSLLAVVPGTVFDERKLHRHFLVFNSHGEWFHPCAELIDLIAEITDAGSLPNAFRNSMPEKSVLWRGRGPRRVDVMARAA